MLNRRSLMIMLPAAAAGVAYSFWPRGNSDAPPAFDLSANAQGSTIDIQDMTMGDPEAPVKVIEYASFTCPHCANFHRDTFKAFKAEYIDTGKVHFTHREVFFDRYGLWAAMMARCGGQERYFGLIDLVYATQGDWARLQDPAEVAGALKRIGLQAGLDSDTLDACMQDATMAQSLVNWYQENAGRDGVQSTPSFLINGEMHSGNMSVTALGELVDAAS
jgi:protein-disulfide isomerase